MVLGHWRTSTKVWPSCSVRPGGAIQASAEGSSTQSRTCSPRVARSQLKRQHTAMSPWLSMTLQKMCQRRGGFTLPIVHNTQVLTIRP